MDVVIPYQLVNKGLELRYCLRSLEKYYKPLANVFIVGEQMPTWLNGAIQIKARDSSANFWYKERNIHNKIMIATEDKRVSDNFLFANDDHFLLEEYEEFPYYYGNPIVEDANRREGNYRETLQNTLDVLGRFSWNYDIHCPIVFNKVLYRKAVGVLDWKKPWGYALKSVYCHANGIEGTATPDCKIQKNLTAEEIEVQLERRKWFSVHDRVMNPALREKLQSLYPEPSRFEKVYAI